MKKYFLFDDEQISGRTYLLRLLISIFLLVTIIGGIWLMASTAFKRARSLGWGQNSSLCAILIPIHMSVGAWPDSLFESNGIYFITIPLWLLQLTLVFRNSVKSNSESAFVLGKIIANQIGKFIYTSFNLRVFAMIIFSILLLKPILHFSLFPDKSMELDTENKTYVNGYSIDGWYYKASEVTRYYDFNSNGLYKHKCYAAGEMFDSKSIASNEFRLSTKATIVVRDISDCPMLYRVARNYGTYNSAYTKNGEKYRTEKDSNLDSYGWPTTVYYYPYKNLNLISHFGLIFKSKLWIFVISFGFTLFLVYVFRDKISSKP